MGSESNGRVFELNFIRHHLRKNAGLTIRFPVAGKPTVCIAKKSSGTMTRVELSRSLELLARREEAIQMDGRKWWTESDKGSEQVR